MHANFNNMYKNNIDIKHLNMKNLNNFNINDFNINDNCQNNDNNIIEEMNTELKGKAMDEAKELYPDYTFRAVVVDGTFLIVTSDIRHDRVNVWLKDGLITNVTKIG